ncbi:hypothetical protein NTE_00717 [Candidatus Nitrososphaera evergladensis SR1]|uniref:Uncharacterized protein n=1 Tax=Candidatus Nitrososphaera evergladensis SR1 TaxID=1459636 RepID=A0A075MPN3_9ARCH|nr:hypothetical protein NTE_00717 [Candidatus Nitrososphaera evergladensis SR1]
MCPRSSDEFLLFLIMVRMKVKQKKKIYSNKYGGTDRLYYRC